ncbi:Quinone oxidoreductase 1 [Pirellulimonas nuda]|uniref:Quinone oxidoreductase 1 n=1 Tax=Pirellulimonas nuda TaxID=2528009 RepID=A0A518DCC4_9BACT|nr:NAD(P)-dependent alcohol dehydrogenase [Pirellulimonas nuda]QDU89134.1 Quinone oxidoreductase 1 [Pirellulimonas nuda]
MKAITYSQYGPPDVLRVTETTKPSPGPNEVLVRTHATTVTSGDWRVRSLDMPPGFKLIARLMFGLTKPHKDILGGELAGVVESVGPDVGRFKVGDRVFAFSGSALGCYVQFKCFPEDGLIVPMPDNVGFEEAAALSFGGTTALDFFRKANLHEGEAVLINGASGGVGTAAVQIAKHLGATVTGVCSSDNASLVESLGADRVIDYQSEDFAALGQKYDVIMDTVGTAPYSRSAPCLNENGRLLLILGGLPDLLRMPWVAATSTKRIVGGAAAERRDDLETLAQLAEAGWYKPVIDRRYTVDQIVEAHRYVDSGRKRGNVIVLWEGSQPLPHTGH